MFITSGIGGASPYGFSDGLNIAPSDDMLEYLLDIMLSIFSLGIALKSCSVIAAMGIGLPSAPLDTLSLLMADTVDIKAGYLVDAAKPVSISTLAARAGLDATGCPAAAAVIPAFCVTVSFSGLNTALLPNALTPC